MKTTAALLAALTLTCGIAAAAPVPVAKKPAAESRTALTDATLETLLKNMGYKYTVLKATGGNIYQLTIKQDTWTYIIDVSLSPSKTKVWLSGWLSQLPKDEKVPAARLLALLEGNWTHGPAHFRYYRGYRQLNLGLCLDNRDVTPAVLREQLDGFMVTMKKSELLWNVKKWKPAEQVTVGKPDGKKLDK